MRLLESVTSLVNVSKRERKVVEGEVKVTEVNSVGKGVKSREVRIWTLRERRHCLTRIPRVRTGWVLE